MTITPHFLTGAALATQTESLVAAFLLGFIFHFVLDAIPHVDPGTFLDPAQPHRGRNMNLEEIHAQDKSWPTWVYGFVLGEFIIVALIMYSLRFRPDFSVLLIGGIGGFFFDAFDSPIFRFLLKLPILKQLHWLHHRVHFDLKPKLWYWGLMTEIIIIAVSLWVLFR